MKEREYKVENLKELSSKILGNLQAESDEVASSRKKDHIEMAFKSQVTGNEIDDRFYYEPLLSAHPTPSDDISINFLGKKLSAPIWVSSMTGGTEEAHTINHNLARACKEFGMGMGLGSCRALLYSDDRLEDFNLRPIIGNEQPLFANLGIAQLEELIQNKAIDRIHALVDLLKADGLIIHVNPFQEWLQPEGDKISMAPIDVIENILSAVDVPLIVKEVGQGMGPKSLQALMRLPLAAVDFGASGGTNFSLLEILRKKQSEQASMEGLAYVGHTAEEMISFINEIPASERKVKEVIISGGVKTFLDGYYLRNKLNTSNIYGQASGFLKHARGEYSELQSFVAAQIEGYKLASCYLKVK